MFSYTYYLYILCVFNAKKERKRLHKTSFDGWSEYAILSGK